jgi:hypothetical protein
MSVGLLGDSAGFLAIAIRAARTADPAAILEQIKVLVMFSVVFGIPLSFAALLTGLALGLGTRWGVFRYPWVTIKLALIISVMVVGGLIINPAQTMMLAGSGDATPQLIAAGAYDVIALGWPQRFQCSSPDGRGAPTVRLHRRSAPRVPRPAADVALGLRPSVSNQTWPTRCKPGTGSGIGCFVRRLTSHVRACSM